MPLSGYGVNNAGYAQEANDLQYRYNTDRMANSYGRFLSQERGKRNLGDLSQNYGRALPGYKAQFAQRGLAGPGINSGAMQRSMGNFVGDFGTSYSRAQQDAQQEARQYDMEAARLDAYLNSGMASIEQRKQQEIANAAMAIEMMRPYMGGI